MANKRWLNNKIEILNRHFFLGALERGDVEFLLDLKNEKSLLLGRIANAVTEIFFDKRCLVRGVVEFSNICKVKCKYCPMNAYNKTLSRFVLDKDSFFDAYRRGKGLGLQTIMLQSGESTASFRFVKEVAECLDTKQKSNTLLCVGDLSKEQLHELIDRGFQNFLLKFETLNSEHYRRLKGVSLSKRLAIIQYLKEKRMNVGSGLIYGIPGQTIDDVVDALMYLQQQRLPMNSVSPFIAAENTIFSDEPFADITTTLNIIAILRLINPTSIIPSVSALNLMDENGQVKGLSYGANEITVNCTPNETKDNFQIYTKNRKITNFEKTSKIVKKAKRQIDKSKSTGISYISFTEELSWYKNRFTDKDISIKKSVYGKVNSFFLDFLKYVDNPKKKRALDLACGDGKYSVELAQHIGAVVSVDRSVYAIQRLLERIKYYKFNNVTTIKNDIFDLSEEDKYDVVVCANLIHDLNKERKDDLIKKISNISHIGTCVYLAFESGIILKDDKDEYFNINRLYNHTLNEIVIELEKLGWCL